MKNETSIVESKYIYAYKVGRLNIESVKFSFIYRIVKWSNQLNAIKCFFEYRVSCQNVLILYGYMPLNKQINITLDKL